MLAKFGTLLQQALLVGCALLFLGLLGCGNSAPQGVPLQGRVVFDRGGTAQSLYDRQGMIELESVDQPGVKAFGEILEDGSFTLSTVKDDQAIQGAVAGTYRGRVNLDDNSKNLVAPQFLSFEKSGISIQVPAPPELPPEVVITVWR